MKFSIVVPAFKAEKFIEECITSISSQSHFVNREYEILVGVDGCKDTLKKIKSFYYKIPNLKLYFMRKNMGTYVTINTLIMKARYNEIVIFGADDIMKPDMIEKINNRVIETGCDMLRFKYYNFHDSMEDPRNFVVPYFSHGAVYISKKAFVKANGYRDWICSGDTEFIARVQNHIKIDELDEILFNRRIHPKAMTSDPKTNDKSELRTGYRKIIAKIKVEGHPMAIDKMVVNVAELYSESAKVTVGMPLYKMDKIAHVAFESLCRQKVNFVWELIVIQEKDGKFNYSPYVERLKHNGCVHIIDIELEEKVSLGYKIKRISELAQGKVVVIQDGDDFSHSNRLAKSLEAIEKGYDYYCERMGYFYNIKTGQTMLFKHDPNIHPTGLNKAYKGKLFKTIGDEILEKYKSIDKSLFVMLKPRKPYFNNVLYEDGFFTDGYNDISLTRIKYYENPRPPFHSTEFKIDDSLVLNENPFYMFDYVVAVIPDHRVDEWMRLCQHAVDMGFNNKLRKIRDINDVIQGSKCMILLEGFSFIGDRLAVYMVMNRCIKTGNFDMKNIVNDLNKIIITGIK